MVSPNWMHHIGRSICKRHAGAEHLANFSYAAYARCCEPKTECIATRHYDTNFDKLDLPITCSSLCFCMAQDFGAVHG